MLLDDVRQNALHSGNLFDSRALVSFDKEVNYNIPIPLLWMAKLRMAIDFQSFLQHPSLAKEVKSETPMKS